MAIFAMITTAASSEYTTHAVDSFLLHTALKPEDQFWVIDNDGSVGNVARLPRTGVQILSNPGPKSFAANVNQILDRAREPKTDVYFLNNDLIFTPDWLPPLDVPEPAILSPLSNREIQYQTENVLWKNALQLSDYLGHETEFAAMVAAHRSRAQGYRTVISLPFFCIKLPFSVYSVVGDLDESFGRGGAEDNDYCIRACLAGFKVHYALASYVLHFSGKSTWSGAETESQTKERCEKFRDVFEKKWGKSLLDIYINENSSLINMDPQALELAKTGDYQGLIRRFLPELDGV